MNSEMLQREVLSIISSGQYPRFRLRAIFTVGNTQIEALNVISKTSSSNFAEHFTADVEIRVMMTSANYNSLFSNRDNIIVTLLQEQIDPTSDVLVNNGITYQEKYKAFLTDNSAAQANVVNGVASSPYTDGTDDLREFGVQLVEQLAFVMATQNAQGIFRYSDCKNSLIAFIISRNNIDVKNGLPKISGIDMVDPDVAQTEASRDQIVVDHTVKFNELPHYLQHNEGGIYNYDIGSFIKNGYWYIYPLYNLTRFKSTERRLTIYQTSSLRIPTADITFSRLGQGITIVCTGGYRMQDISVAGDIQAGLGTRFTKATDFFDNQAVVDGTNKAVFNRAGISASFTTTTRADGYQIAQTSGSPFTDNLLRENSKISARAGTFMYTTWQRSESRLLTPGMPTRVYLDTGNGVQILEGVLLQVGEKFNLERPGMTQKLQKSAAGLMLYLEKQ